MNNKILPIASMFDDAYNILHDKMQSGAKYHNEKNLALIIPVAVNCAFACELFLKSMLPDGTKGHELKELFNSL